MADHTRWPNDSPNTRDSERFGLLYEELKKIAWSRMPNERTGHTLGATALVHEAWLRLERGAPQQWLYQALEKK